MCPSLASYRTDKRDRTDGPQLQPRTEYLDDRDDHDLTPDPAEADSETRNGPLHPRNLLIVELVLSYRN